ncbi:hypothetical protein ACFYXM_17695 [Streptomyces sp. NPDC002476]|uniref:hypothetical protein n=1 Tax=Streptomyces sp. NPDC002476 TaxID=3364648 RepID=UPI0036C664AE
MYGPLSCTQKVRIATGSGFSTPPVAEGAEHVHHQYTIRIGAESGKNRETVSRELLVRGIGNAVCPAPAQPQARTLWKAIREDAPIPEPAKKSPATDG